MKYRNNYKMVIDKLSKKCIYPKYHLWTTTNKQLAGYLNKSSFTLELCKTSIIASKFNGFRLSKSLTNNVFISAIDNGRIIGTIAGTIDDINKAFVHYCNKKITIDSEFVRFSKLTLIKYLIGKPTATDNQIAQYLKTVRFKSTTVDQGLTISDINTCKTSVIRLIKTLRITNSNYVIDDKLIDTYKLNNIDILLEAKSYRSKFDQFNYDKKIINDRRYKQPNQSKIISTLLDYRLRNKQLIPIKFTETNKDPIVWNSALKLKVNNQFQSIDMFKIQYIDWDRTLTSATIVFNNKLTINIDSNNVTIKQDTTTKQYRLLSFNTVLIADSTLNWPSTFKNNTTIIKTILNGFSTDNRINGVATTVDKFEAMYQELTEQQQKDSVGIFKTIQRFIDTINVDNVDILLYYLLRKDTNHVCFNTVII